MNGLKVERVHYSMEDFMKENIVYAPTKNELKEATLKVLDKANCECTTKYINEQVSKVLKLSEKNLMIVDDWGVGTEFYYRMRWIRTELKEEGKIKNTKRGIWRKA